MSNTMGAVWDILCNPLFFIAVCLLFLSLAAKRREWPDRKRIVLAVCIMLCFLYFIFLFWLSSGFGRNAAPPDGEPVPAAWEG